MLRDHWGRIEAMQVDIASGRLLTQLSTRAPAHVPAGVRDYWSRQWAAIDPTVEPGAVTTRPDGKVAVDVHQLVRSLDGTLLGEGDVVHVYSFRGALIARMDVEDPEGRPAEH
jgi:hypothetical protein